jgi:hypothetical protein
MTWQRTKYGLFVLGDDPRGSDVVESNLGQRKEGISARMSTWLNAATTVFAVLGFVLAYMAFRDQQDVNRSQQSINRQQEQRIERRYADRVAWWDEFTKAGVVVHIQNRSTVPINDVKLYGVYVHLVRNEKRRLTLNPDRLEHAQFASIGDIPPCTLISTRPFESPRGSYRTVVIAFRDPIRSWTKRNPSAPESDIRHGLSLMKSIPRDPSDPGYYNQVRRENVSSRVKDLSDCSDSS